MKTPINEQLRILLNWLDNHNQFIVDKIKTIDDAIKLQKYCKDNNIAYFDNLNDSYYYTMDETSQHSDNITELLGYAIF